MKGIESMEIGKKMLLAVSSVSAAFYGLGIGVLALVVGAIGKTFSLVANGMHSGINHLRHLNEGWLAEYCLTIGIFAILTVATLFLFTVNINAGFLMMPMDVLLMSFAIHAEEFD